MKNLLLALLSILLITTFISCGDDDDAGSKDLTLNFSGLEDLGSEATYEGWLIVDGNPVSTGVFNVNADGVASRNEFQVASEDLENASTFVLTIEPSPDNDPAPSDVHILAGDFDGTNADLTIGHEAALGKDFSESTGAFILATPTDMDDTNEDSGIWFLDNSSGSAMSGLSLPTLPAGWAYEGWVVLDGTPISTGTFTEMDTADNSTLYSGDVAGPNFPGEDFLLNAPDGFTFPIDLKGSTAVISIEPVPDNNTAPFTLKPLVGGIPSSADVHSTIAMDRNLTFPTGTVLR